MNAKIIFISGAIFLAVITAYFLSPSEPETLTCSAKNYLHLEAQTQGVKLKVKFCWFFVFLPLPKGGYPR